MRTASVAAYNVTANKLLFLSFSVPELFSVANRHSSICVCVCLKSSTCVYLALPDTLAQGLICRALPSQRAFCSTTVLECFLGHLAGGSRTGAQRSVRPMALLPFAMLGWVWLRSGCSEDSRLCLFSDGMWQQPIGRQRSLAQLHLNHKRDSWSLFFFFFACVSVFA